VCQFVSKISTVLPKRKVAIMKHLSTVFGGLDVVDPCVAWSLRSLDLNSFFMGIFEKYSVFLINDLWPHWIRDRDWDFVMNQSKIQNLRLVFLLIG